MTSPALPSKRITKPSFPERFFLGWTPAILCAAVIFYLSSRPSGSFPSPWFPHMDKFVHAAEFGLFAFLLFRAMTWPQYTGFKKERLRRVSLQVLAITAIYALSDEIHQIFVPGRSAGFGDWAADMVGASIAVSLCLYLARPVVKSGSG